LRRYETIFISATDLPPEELQEIAGKCSQLIEARKGIVIRNENWGKRKFAYPIEKQKFGIYTLVEFASDHGTLGELDRLFRFDDRILRYQTVKVSDSVDLAALEKELAEARGKAEGEAPKPEEAVAAAESAPVEPAAPAETAPAAEEKGTEG
jgi:small subunit ribosomal protein S6